MKKNLVLVLSAVMITTALAGCSSKKGEAEEQTQSQVGFITESEKEGTVEYFGRVKKVLGNEIEVELASYEQFVEDAESLTENADKQNGGAASAMETSEPVSSDEVIVPDTGSLLGVDLTFTGEFKTFRIPAGTKIEMAWIGGEVPSSDIKENNILLINAKEDSDISTVAHISIMN